MSNIQQQLRDLMSYEGPQDDWGNAQDVARGALAEIKRLESVLRECRRHALAECPSEPLKNAICRITYDAGVDA